MNTTKYKTALKTYLDSFNESIYETLFDNKAMIAGGSIRSIFCGQEIKDIDIYFRTKEQVVNTFIEFRDIGTLVSFTDKSASFFISKDGEQLVLQLIFFKCFELSSDIFDTFDFDCCMAAYDFTYEDFVFNEGFVSSNIEKVIKVNEKTSYPIISLLRVKKYETYGYKVPQKEIVKLALAVSKLNITSWAEFKSQISGMYGLKDFFDDNIDKEFSMDEAIKAIDEFDPKTYQSKSSPFNSDIPNQVLYKKITGEKSPFYCLNKSTKNGLTKCGGRIFQLTFDSEFFYEVNSLFEITGNCFKKLLNKRPDGTFSGKYRSNFIYELNKEAVDSTGHGLYFYDLNYSTYSNPPDVIGHFYVEEEDFVKCEGSNTFLFKKAYFYAVETQEEKSLDDLF
jgi:hypothetical protein